MNPKIVIRSETDADVSAIAEVTVAAFRTLEISNHTEQFIIEALTLSLIGGVIGIIFGVLPAKKATLPLQENLVEHRGVIQPLKDFARYIVNTVKSWFV